MISFIEGHLPITSVKFIQITERRLSEGIDSMFQGNATKNPFCFVSFNVPNFRNRFLLFMIYDLPLGLPIYIQYPVSQQQ
jgi:hypothetical protein